MTATRKASEGTTREYPAPTPTPPCQDPTDGSAMVVRNPSSTATKSGPSLDTYRINKSR